MGSERILIILGIFVLILSIVIIALPFLSSGISYALYWLGSISFIIAGLYAIIAGNIQKKVNTIVCFLLGLFSFCLLMFSNISGIIYNYSLFYLDDLSDFFRTFEGYFFMTADFEQALIIMELMSFLWMKNPFGIKIHHLFYTFSIVKLLLTVCGFCLIIILSFLVLTQKYPKKPRISKIHKRSVFGMPFFAQKENEKNIIENCPKCKAPLNKNQIEDLINKRITQCDFCGSIINFN